jgi:hypothetical protein
VTLQFPNPIRSYNEAHRDITFWGHDTAMEITFVIERQALEMIGRTPDLDEKALCETFDQHVDQIHSIAKRLYEDHKTGFYRLTAEHFA